MHLGLLLLVLTVFSMSFRSIEKSYGFQKLPPVEAAIDMLHRSAERR